MLANLKLVHSKFLNLMYVSANWLKDSLRSSADVFLKKKQHDCPLQQFNIRNKTHQFKTVRAYISSC